MRAFPPSTVSRGCVSGPSRTSSVWTPPKSPIVASITALPLAVPVFKNDLVINAQTSYRARETGGIIQDQRMLTGSCEGNRGPLRDRSAYLECRACVDLVLSSSAQIAIDNQRAVGNDLSNSTVIDCK